MTKLCVDCLHFGGMTCHRVKAPPCPVDGSVEVEWVYARTERKHTEPTEALLASRLCSRDPCGPAGKHWTPKPPRPPSLLGRLFKRNHA